MNVPSPTRWDIVGQLGVLCRHWTVRLVAQMIFCRHYAVSSDLAQERQMILPTVPNPCFAQRFSLLDSLIGSDVASDAYGTTFVSAIWISCLLKTNPWLPHQCQRACQCHKLADPSTFSPQRSRCAHSCMQATVGGGGSAWSCCASCVAEWLVIWRPCGSCRRNRSLQLMSILLCGILVSLHQQTHFVVGSFCGSFPAVVLSGEYIATALESIAAQGPGFSLRS